MLQRRQSPNQGLTPSAKPALPFSRLPVPSNKEEEKLSSVLSQEREVTAGLLGQACHLSRGQTEVGGS